MPLEIELPAAGSATLAATAESPLVIGLINNMPDSAVAGTERQFGALLSAAAQDREVRLRFSCLPEIERTALVAQRIESRYWPLAALLAGPLDALIVTGTEPRAGKLQDEPYWARLVELLEFADRLLPTSIWSCLAAHAAVFALDGIDRRRLPRKRSGVYEHSLEADSPLTVGLGGQLVTPHSRWNDVDANALRAAGYAVVSASDTNGADLFTTQRDSLMVFFQGHPEYETTTLLKEYRRDVGRFLAGETAGYPSLPVDYLDATALTALTDYGVRAAASPTSVSLQDFPYALAVAGIRNRWADPAVRVFRNWLGYLAAEKGRRRRR